MGWDWITSLAFASSFAEHRQRKERQKREQEITDHWNEVAAAVFYLSLLLNELCFSQNHAIDDCHLGDLKELAPLFPMAEILSVQGCVGLAQEKFLQNYFNVHETRYNIKQFLTAAIDREGVYPQWDALCGLRENHCGEIWHTLIEIVCRLRDPEKFQQAGNYLSSILRHFWLLDYPNIEPAEVRLQHIASNLNVYAANDQQLPYLHAVMFLQRILSERYGGEIADYFPKLSSDRPYLMDGTEGFLFMVRRKNDFDFHGSYAVRKTEEPHDCDLGTPA